MVEMVLRNTQCSSQDSRKAVVKHKYKSAASNTQLLGFEHWLLNWRMSLTCGKVKR